MEINKNGINTQKLLLRSNDAAVVLSMSPRTLWALAVSGEIPSFKQGNSRFFSRASLEAWIASKLHTASVEVVE